MSATRGAGGNICSPALSLPSGWTGTAVSAAACRELQIVLTIAAIVREADVVLERPERPLKIKLSPAAHPDGSVRMCLVRRQDR